MKLRWRSLSLMEASQRCREHGCFRPERCATSRPMFARSDRSLPNTSQATLCVERLCIARTGARTAILLPARELDSARNSLPLARAEVPLTCESLFSNLRHLYQKNL